MKPHFSEADLIETYYLRPGQSLPVMMHLADCAECAARYERLEEKMQSLRACAHAEKPDTFWTRQRMSVMRRIAVRRSSRFALSRLAAAAVLVLTLGGLFAWQRAGTPSPGGSPPAVTTQAALPDEAAVSPRAEDSPWASDELEEYSPLVEWESWVENGDQS